MITVRQKCGELLFEIVFLICLANKIQNGQTFFSFRKTQTTSKLLKKNGQGLCRTKKEYGIYFGDIDTLIVQIHNEDKFDFSRY